MIKMTYQQLSALNQNPALTNKLVNTPLPTKTAYELKKLFDALGMVFKMATDTAGESRLAIQKKYCVKDAKTGELVVNPENQELTVLEGKREVLDQEMKELMLSTSAQELTIPRNPIKLSQIMGAGQLQLSVGELAQLETIVVDDTPPDAEQPQTPFPTQPAAPEPQDKVVGIGKKKAGKK